VKIKKMKNLNINYVLKEKTIAVKMLCIFTRRENLNFSLSPKKFWRKFFSTHINASMHGFTLHASLSKIKNQSE